MPTDPQNAAAADWRALYPFDSHHITVAGHRYHYIDEGSGPAILLVHGNPTWSFHWRALVRALRGSFRLVAPDHLGSGLSDKPNNWPYRLAGHIDNLVQLVERLELDEITLVAHDWGGAIGLGAALAVPERFARFVLFNTGAYPPWFIPWRIRVCRWPFLGKLGVQGLNLFARAALRMTMTHPERLTPAVRAGYLAPYDSWSARVGIYGFVRDIPLSPRHPTYQTLTDIESGLPTLADRPFQLNWGMRDWCFTPECLQRFVELLPEAEVNRFEDAGHWIVEDAFEEVLPTVERFLASQPLLSARGGDDG